MKHLFTDLVLEESFANELFLKWLDSNQEYDYITFLKLQVMHRCEGGGANKDIDLLKKTIMVLISQLEK
jgi:hypothetical protein